MAEGPNVIEVQTAEELVSLGRIPDPQLIEHVCQIAFPGPMAHHRRAITDHHKPSARQILDQKGIRRRNRLTARGEQEYGKTLWRSDQWDLLPRMNNYRSKEFGNIL